jgi:hypothetical protein
MVTLAVNRPGPANDYGEFAAQAATQWGTSPSTEMRDYQASTFMHEFGHTLGLRHGGNANTPNCKPNYLSVMSYSRQFNNAGRAQNLPGIANGTLVRNQRAYDFSSSSPPLPNLNEAALNENNGIQGPPGLRTIFGRGGVSMMGPTNGSIDYNGVNGLEAAGVEDVSRLAGINGCHLASPGDVLSAQEDWSQIVYHFRESSDFADGAHEVDEPAPDAMDAIDVLNGALGGADGDEDGVENAVDNCILVPNADQADGNGDGIGDVCIKGDAFVNGSVLMSDALVTAQCVLGIIDCEDINRVNADANCANFLSMSDALLIAQRALGLIPAFPC